MNLNVNSILIVGLGMIGSSIALSSKLKGIKVYGLDVKKSISERVKERRKKVPRGADTNQNYPKTKSKYE